MRLEGIKRRMKSKNFLAALLGVVVLTIVFFLVYLPGESERTLKEIQNNFGNLKLEHSPSLTTDIFWWDTKDGYSITGLASSTYISFPCGENLDAYKTQISKIYPDVEGILTSHGFVKNIENSSTSTQDQTFYDYVSAYEKEGAKCTITANPDCMGDQVDKNKFSQSISVACIDDNDFQKLYRDEYQILKELNEKGAMLSGVFYSNDNQFLRANINWRRTGAYIVEKRDGSSWKHLITGQDIPSCKIVIENKIPKEIIPSCYNVQTGKTEEVK